MPPRRPILALFTLATLLAPTPFAHADDKDKPAELPKDIELFDVYVAPDKSFEIMHPAAWKATPGKAPALVTIADDKPPGQRTGLMLIATLSRPGQELKDAAKAFKAAAPRKIHGYKAVDDAFYDIGDWKVYRMVYDTTGQNDIIVRQINYMILKDGVLYNLVFAGPPEHYKEDEERANQICGGLKINARPKFEAPAPPRGGGAEK